MLSNFHFVTLISVRLTLFSLAFAILFCCPLMGMAQEERGSLDLALSEAGIFESKEHFRQSLKGLKSLRDPVVDQMIPILEAVALGRPIKASFLKKDETLRLLGIKAVREELEIVDAQIEEMNSVSEELRESLKQEILQLKFDTPEEAGKLLRDIHQSSQQKMVNVFLPHQQERFRQVQIQIQMQRKSLVGMLTSEPIVSELDISDAQAQQLAESAKQINQDLAQKVKELREEARKQLLANLDASQNRKLNDLIGEEFEIKSMKKAKKARIDDPKSKKDKVEKKKDRKKEKAADFVD